MKHINETLTRLFQHQHIPWRVNFGMRNRTECLSLKIRENCCWLQHLLLVTPSEEGSSRWLSVWMEVVCFNHLVTGVELQSDYSNHRTEPSSSVERQECISLLSPLHVLIGNQPSVMCWRFHSINAAGCHSNQKSYYCTQFYWWVIALCSKWKTFAFTLHWQGYFNDFSWNASHVTITLPVLLMICID